MKTVALLFFFLFSVFYALFSWYRIVTTTAPDFSVFYGAARLLIEGKLLSGDTGLYTGFAYPPTTLLLFLPFVFLPYPFSQGLWVSISFLMIPLVSYLSLKLIQKDTAKNILLWSCIVFWSFPTRWTIGMGQVNLVSVALLLMGCLYLQQKKLFISSLLFCFLLVSKPHFMFLFPYLVLMGYWRISVGAMLLYAGATFVTAAGFGVEYFLSYIQKEVPPLLVFAGREIYYNQSLGAFFSRVFSQEMAKILTQITSLGLLGGLAIVAKRTYSIVLFLSFFLAIFLLVEPLGWQHHFVFVLPVYIVLWYKNVSRITLALSYLLISWNFKQPEFIDNPIVLSHAFLGVVILLLINGIIFVKSMRTVS
jgi:hypothetical protein